MRDYGTNQTNNFLLGILDKIVESLCKLIYIYIFVDIIISPTFHVNFMLVFCTIFKKDRILLVK